MILYILLIILVFWLYANRNPDRITTSFDGYVSPADGKVIAILDAKDKMFVNKKKHGITLNLQDFPDAKHVIVIMMRVWDVHVQRAPQDGVVKNICYRKGAFKNAVFGNYLKATVENENLSMTVKSKRPYKLFLVAGLLSRRIKSLVRVNDEVSQGDRIGRIYVGSQVVLVIPESKILVKVGDKVFAGMTKLAQ